MAKVKSTFFCKNCGNESPKWLGKCPSCNEWNTFIEEKVVKTKSGNSQPISNFKSEPVSIKQVEVSSNPRISSGLPELDRVLGGGFVPGSVTLLGGEPGIGKSTLSLQLSLLLNDEKVLYVSGEESAEQIKLRADRLNSPHIGCTLLVDTDLKRILNHLESFESSLVIIDSIQTIHSNILESTPGSISQIKECAGELLRYAKTTSTPIVLIGHITKDGNIAGPKVLEHMVDTVLQFEGDRNHIFRVLRSIKNRFGSTNELGIFEMKMTGLKEVKNPSDVLLGNKNTSLSGVAIASSIEGMRPLLIETQALVSSAVYGTPQRSATGFDLRRLSMLLAVLEKRCGFRLGAKDVFLNITGGLKVDDPGIDLAVVAAVLSSSEDISIDKGICFASEIGLSGELRPVSRVEQRISEAKKLGFSKILISQFALKGIEQNQFDIEIVAYETIDEVFTFLFG